MRSNAVLTKLRRLQRGGDPRVLDLYSGCGGLSLGFHRAGFTIAGAVESDPDAAASHAANFHAGDKRHARARDITMTSPKRVIRSLGLGEASRAIDIIVGGPPCQAFARVGRPKLREVYEHPHAYRRDPRAKLYLEYLHFVDELEPLALLMENVPDALNHGGQNIAQEICDVLKDRGFVCGYTLLNAAHYGVPQMRERMFLIAYRQELGAEISFPSPITSADLPTGYQSSRAVALKHMNGHAREAVDYVEPPRLDRRLKAAVTAEAAIGDLPSIHARSAIARGDLVRGTRQLDVETEWDERRGASSYSELMQTWPGFEASDTGVTAHVIRWLPRDYETFARMRQGDQYPEALEIAEERFEEALEALGRKAPTDGSAAWLRLRASIVPPYDDGKFPNKWRKLWRHEPARTLMAHLGKDSYSHIHYDSRQARTISVREAARLQSFPDGFVFSGAMNQAFRQIGNAVPPLMAAAIAGEMRAVLHRRALQRNSKKDDKARSV